MRNAVILLPALFFNVLVKSQNIGIGTTTPDTKLTIAGTENTFHGKNAALKITNSSPGGTNWYLRSGATGTYTPAGGFSIANDLIYVLSISNSGNIGIGTVTPNQKLEVNGVGQFSGNTLVGSGIPQGFFGDGGNFAIRAYNTNSSDIYFQTYNGDYTNMIIKNNGYIGIGTQNPPNNLSVVGNADFSGSLGIGTTAINASAKLEISSGSQGFLPPRLTIAQRNSILNPAAGLVIFCSDCFELEVSDGINWKSMNGTAACVSATLPSINIGSQTWMPTNLAVSKYRNGDNIPEVTDPAVWSNITTGAWCWYNNDSATYSATYGKLYNWYAVHDSRGLAPAGWHIPGDAEVNTLSAYLDGDAVAGYKMKEAGTVHWNSPNSAVNSSGFTGLPGGLRSTYGVFSSRGFGGYFWSATEQGAGSAIAYWLTAPNSSLFRGANEKWEGYSVRCVKD